MTVVGGGIRMIPPTPQTLCLAIQLDLDWHELNRKQQFRLELVDEDGRPVLSDDGQSPLIEAGGEFQMGPHAAVRPGTQLTQNIAIPLPPVPLQSGKAYTWRVEVAGQEVGGSASVYVIEAPVASHRP